jgi:2-dehydro-3-deoxygluconokinase
MTDPLDRIEVVTLGEILVALVAADAGPLRESTTFRRHVVGAESNLAIGLSRLGHRTAYVGRVGADAFGAAVVSRLRAEGVDVSQLAVMPDAWTGLLFRERRGIGPSEVFYQRNGSAGAALEAGDVVRAKDLIEQASWLHVSGITPALSSSAAEAVDVAVDLARELGVEVSIDLNIRRKLWGPEEAIPVLRGLVSRCDLVLGGHDEVEFLTGVADADEAAAAALDLGPSMLVLKLGADGATAYAPGASPLHSPAVPVERPVDLVGAGDAFAAGFLAGRLEQLPVDECLELGNVCGAFAVVSDGDITGLPSREEARRASAGRGKVLR